MKTAIKHLIQFILLTMIIAGCSLFPTTISVTSVTLNTTAIEIEVGDITELLATISPSDATNQTIIWSSSNAGIASVNNGIIEGHKEGTAIITAKSDDGAKTASCEVTVKAKVYAVTSVELDKTTAELTEGEEMTLTATLKPDNATNKNVSWSSDDPSVAFVESGKVKALKAGTATITVKTDDGGRTASCKITVNSNSVPATSVELDKTTAELTEGEEITLTATVKPDNATNKNVSWSSDDPSVATVKEGKVKAVKEGKTLIVVWTHDGGKIATCEVRVITAETGDDNEHVDENKGDW